MPKGLESDSFPRCSPVIQLLKRRKAAGRTPTSPGWVMICWKATRGSSGGNGQTGLAMGHGNGLGFCEAQEASRTASVATNRFQCLFIIKKVALDPVGAGA